MVLLDGRDEALAILVVHRRRERQHRLPRLTGPPPHWAEPVIPARDRHDRAEPLGVLLLPCELERFEHADHVRGLLQIPRVLALEPPRRRVPRWLRDTIPARQVKRLRLPGEPRLVLLYHPAQYPLARALCARYAAAELWYRRPDPATLPSEGAFTREELVELDGLARERARCDQPVEGRTDEPLRIRLGELEIINHRPFVPGARIHYG